MQRDDEDRDIALVMELLTATTALVFTGDCCDTLAAPRREDPIEGLLTARHYRDGSFQPRVIFCEGPDNEEARILQVVIDLSIVNIYVLLEWFQVRADIH